MWLEFELGLGKREKNHNQDRLGTMTVLPKTRFVEKSNRGASYVENIARQIIL